MMRASRAERVCTLIHPGVCLRHINDTVGHGLIAVERIPIGTITWCLDPLDIQLTAAEATALGPMYAPTLDRYTWTDREGQRVLCWDAGRFMNHSCRPTSMSPGLSFEVAIRDIEVGEELVCDYATLNLEAPFECACGLPECRGTIEPTDFDRFAERWDVELRAIFPQILHVPQPLMGLLPSRERAMLEDLCAHPAKVPSVLTHRYPPVVSQGAASRSPRLAQRSLQ